MLTEKRIITFPLGIPGFETYRDFMFIPEENSPVAQLISQEEENIRFILLYPQSSFPEYLENIEVTDESIKNLNLEAGAKKLVDVWLILTLNHNDPTKTTANLRAPLLFTLPEGIGVQVILNDDKYMSRTPLFAQENKRSFLEGVVE